MEQLSQYATNTEPVLQGLEATTSKPTHREADAQQKRRHRNEKPTDCHQRKACVTTKTQQSPKQINKMIKEIVSF